MQSGFVEGKKIKLRSDDQNVLSATFRVQSLLNVTSQHHNPERLSRKKSFRFTPIKPDAQNCPQRIIDRGKFTISNAIR